MDQAIDNLVISVTASADSAARSLDRLGNSVRSMGGSARSAGSDMSALGNETKKVDSTIQRAARDASTSGGQIKRVGKDMEEAGKSAKKGSSGLAHFWSSLTRIAYYRAIRTIIKDMMQSFKDLYGWSKANNTQFSKSMDTLTTSMIYLRNSIAAAIAPIINALAPAIDKIVDLVVGAINVVNQFFAALSGAKTYTVAKKVQTTWESTFDNTSKKAKQTSDDIKRTILGFDEINKLDDQNKKNSSSSTGSSPYTKGYKEMFETKPLTGFFLTLSNWINEIGAGGGKVIAGILAGLAAIKLAIAALKTPIKAVTELAKSFMKVLVGKTIKLAVSLVRTGWETIKGWALSFGAAVVDLAVKIKTSVLELWARFAASWAALHPVVQVGIVASITALALWAAFKLDWLRIPDKLLEVKLAIQNTAEELWGDVKRGWNSVKETLGFSIQPEVATSASTAGKPQGVGVWEGAGVRGDLPGDENPLLISQLGKMFSNINLPNVNFSSLKKNVHDISGKLLPILVGIIGVGAAASALPSLGANANALLLTDQNKLKSQVKKMPTNAAALAYASKNPRSNNNIIRFDPTIGMSDAAKQKAKEFASAIVSNMGTVKTTISDTIDTSKTVLGGMATLIEQAARDSQNVSWEPVGRNITQTLSKGETQSFPEAKAKFNRDMEALRNSGYTYSYDAVGKYIISTLTTGIDTEKWKPIKSVLDMAWSMFNKKEEVPWITFGNEIPQEVSNGVNNNKNWAVQAAVDLGFAMYNAMNGVSFWDIGYNIIADVYNGFVNNTSWLANTLANTAKGLYNIMSGKTAVIATSTTTSRKTTVSNAKKPTKSAKAKSLGGILSNGIWTDIPQFANGTLSAGSLFWAGEAGPEIVGHVGGRTEVLNKSQLASAIYSAVQSAMAPAASNFAAAASSMRNPDAGQADYETLLMYIQQGNDATMRQNELLRQQNDYLRSINDKEWTAELTTAAVQRSLNRSNLRAGTTVVPVG